MSDTNPIEDPAKLIESLEGFYQMIAQGITVNAYHSRLDCLGADLQAIKDTTTRAHAIRLFHCLGSGAHLLSLGPESQVLPIIRALIDFLKEKQPPS